jgi:hypothetical protein
MWPEQRDNKQQQTENADSSIGSIRDERAENDVIDVARARTRATNKRQHTKMGETWFNRLFPQ